MKNTIKTIGILFIIATTVLIAACGPGLEPEVKEKTYTVTFMADGTTYKTETVKDGDKVSKPADPTPSATPPDPDEKTTAGFYVLTSTTFNPGTLDVWKVDSATGATYDFDDPVTKNITLVATWKNRSGGKDYTEVSGVTVSSLTTVFNKINTDSATTKNSYLLVLGTGIPLTSGNTNNDVAGLNYGDLKITKAAGVGEVNITSSFALGSSAALVIGQSNAPANYVAPKLTVEGVGFRGSCTIKSDNTLEGTGVANSLIRVQSGSTLFLGEGSSVKGHKNTVGGTGGATGNGSAVCVVGSTLHIKGGIIEYNESSYSVGATGNRNLVGGVYTIASSTAGPTLIIEGGTIDGNVAKDNQTKDVYATEGGTFKMSGNVMISEITINGDAPGTADTTLTTAPDAVRAEIEVSNLGEFFDVTLSLRTTATDVAVNNAVWMGRKVLKAPTGGDVSLSATDLAKFHLGDFKWKTGNQKITGLTLGSNGTLGAE
jgi:hypothetical protein